MEKNYENNNENVVEWISGDKTATVTLTQRKHITKVKKLYEKNKDDFEAFIENKDGSVCARIPLSYIKISPPRKVSEEQREAASKRFSKMNESKSL